MGQSNNNNNSTSYYDNSELKPKTVTIIITVSTIALPNWLGRVWSCPVKTLAMQLRSLPMPSRPSQYMHNIVQHSAIPYTLL